MGLWSTVYRSSAQVTYGPDSLSQARALTSYSCSPWGWQSVSNVCVYVPELAPGE